MNIKKSNENKKKMEKMKQCCKSECRKWDNKSGNVLGNTWPGRVYYYGTYICIVIVCGPLVIAPTLTKRFADQKQSTT